MQHMTCINQTKIPMPKLWLAEVDGFLRQELKLKSQELTIVFLNPAAAQKLNKKYRKRNYATDILSFPSDSPATLGELILCPQVLKRQAKEHGLSFKAELSYMLIHGVLHLLGYDHEKSKSSARRMFKIQDQLFDRLCRKFDI
jgi:probable rRNA maturation factor